MKKSKLVNYLLLLTLLLVLMPSLKAEAKVSSGPVKSNNSFISAKSWVPEDASVYGDDSNAAKIDTKDEKSDPGMLEGLLISLINGIGSFFKWLFGLLGLNLQNVVYGRVNGGGVVMGDTRVSLFTFELAKGNPYGIVAAQIYSIIRGIIYVLMACAILVKLVTVLFISNSSKALSQLKEQFSSMIIGFALLALMPSLVDLLLYIRDIGIHAIGVKGMESLGVSTPDLATFFYETRENSIMSALMYVGSFALTLYFAFQYIGIALSMVVDLFAFPFVVLSYQFNKKALGTWFKSVISNALVPIVDCCLLMIPAVFGLLGSTAFAVNVIQLMVCSMLIPARREIRTVLGVASNNAMELSGLMAMRGASMAMGAAVAGTVGAAAGMHHAMSEAKEDENMASYYDDLANTEKVQGETGGSSAGVSAMSMGGQSGSSSSGGSEPTSAVNGERVSGVTGQPNVQGDLYGTEVRSGKVGSAHGMDLSNPADRNANVHNFEDHAFANMSNARKAELYRQRASMKRKQGVAEAGAKFGGTVLGMGAGLAATTFMSPAAKGIAMGALGSMGRDIGAGAVGMAASRVGTDSLFVPTGEPQAAESAEGSEENNVVYGLPDKAVGNNEFYGLPDKEVQQNYVSRYMNANDTAVNQCSQRATDMKNNTKLKTSLDEYYGRVMNDQDLTSQDEKYSTFRNYAATQMGNDFEKSLHTNKNLKSCGNKQQDDNAKKYISNILKSKLENENCQSLSKTNLELHGYKFE